MCDYKLKINESQSFNFVLKPLLPRNQFRNWLGWDESEPGAI